MAEVWSPIHDAGCKLTDGSRPGSAQVSATSLWHGAASGNADLSVVCCMCCTVE